MSKVMSTEQAALLVKSGDTVIFNGFGSMGFPEELAAAIGERFVQSGEPKDMDFICGVGQGVWQQGRMIEHMSRPGMVKSIICSHLTPMLGLCAMVQRNEIEGYNLPLGVISHLTRASAGKKPGILTKIGLNTFIDPRLQSARLNEKSTRQLMELQVVAGEEYLFYKAIHPTVALLRGTTLDANGNIGMEKEAMFSDAYYQAACVKANGGTVIVQVERISGTALPSRAVIIPDVMADAVVVAPGQWQNMIEPYTPSYTDETRLPKTTLHDAVEAVKALNIEAGRKRERNRMHEVIAKRAARELIGQKLVNLGIGIPEMVPQGALDLDMDIDFTLSVESGIIGGMPSAGLSFGCVFNPECIMDLAKIFDAYNGGLLDITFVGAMQVDQAGNVNVSKAGDRIIGVGGFVDLTQCAKKVVYCFPFSAGGLEVSFESGGISIVKEGKHKKFTTELDQLSASAIFALRQHQRVLYITERCVFELTPRGIELTEIAPGISLEKDILEQMPFKPLISEQLRLMETILFT